MKPSDIVRKVDRGEDPNEPSGIKLLGIVIGTMIAGISMLLIIIWLAVILDSAILACIVFLVGTIVFCKLLNEIYYWMYPDKMPVILKMKHKEREKEREEERKKLEEIERDSYKPKFGDPMYKIK